MRLLHERRDARDLRRGHGRAALGQVRAARARDVVTATPGATRSGLIESSKARPVDEKAAHGAGLRVVVAVRRAERDRHGAAREQRGRRRRALIAGEHRDRQLHAIVQPEGAGRARRRRRRARARWRRRRPPRPRAARSARRRAAAGRPCRSRGSCRRSRGSRPRRCRRRHRPVRARRRTSWGRPAARAGAACRSWATSAPSSGTASTPVWMPLVPSATSTVGSAVRPSLAPTASQPGEAAGEAIVPKRPPVAPSLPAAATSTAPSALDALRGDRLGRRAEGGERLGERCQDHVGVVGEIAVAVRVERAIEAGQQRRGRAHERALLHLEHLDRHERRRPARRRAGRAGRRARRRCPAIAVACAAAAGSGGSVCGLPAIAFQAGREVVQVRMRAVDRAVEQRDRHALAVAAAGRERARGGARASQVPGHRGRRVETPHGIHAGDLGRGAQLRDLIGAHRRRDRVERVDEAVLDGHPDAGARRSRRGRAAASRWRSSTRPAPSTDTAGGAASTMITCCGSAWPERPSPITTSHERSACTQRIGRSVDGERDDARERCRQRENERARAQAAAARHDPLRVHDRLRWLGRSTPPGGCARRRRARGSRGPRARGAAKAAAAIMAALSTHRAGGSRLSRAPRSAQASRQRLRAARRWPPRRRRPRARSGPWRRAPRRRARRAAGRSPPESPRRGRPARSGQLVAELAHAPQERRLQAREREIVAVLPAQHRREREARGIAVARDELERGASGVAQPEQARALVERLARRVVARAAEPHRRRVVGHVEHERVPARGQQARERRLQRERREPQRRDVAEQVVDRHERQAAPVGQRLGRREPDEQRADQARALRHRDGVDVGERRLRPRRAPPR